MSRKHGKQPINRYVMTKNGTNGSRRLRSHLKSQLYKTSQLFGVLTAAFIRLFAVVSFGVIKKECIIISSKWSCKMVYV